MRSNIPSGAGGSLVGANHYGRTIHPLIRRPINILALKGNQGTLRKEVFTAEQKANGFKDTKISQHCRRRPRPDRDQSLYGHPRCGLAAG
jgi:hypothetical protein